MTSAPSDAVLRLAASARLGGGTCRRRHVGTTAHLEGSGALTAVETPWVDATFGVREQAVNPLSVLLESDVHFMDRLPLQPSVSRHASAMRLPEACAGVPMTLEVGLAAG
jgi:hypothetical protein